MSAFPNIPLPMFKNYELKVVNPMMNNIELIKSQYEIVASSAEYEGKDVLSTLKNNRKLNF